MNKKKIISSVIFGICIITILVLSIIDIINVGIKHSGINLIVPEVIEQEQLDSIKILSKNPKLYDNFELVKKTEEGKIPKKYPEVKYKNIYIYNGKDKGKITKDIIKYEAFLELSKDLFKEEKLSVNPTTVKYLVTLATNNKVKDLYKSMDSKKKSELKKYAKEYAYKEFIKSGASKTPKLVKYWIIKVLTLLVLVVATYYFVKKVILA